MIQTVTGAIDKKDLGVTLSHEHVLINMTNCVDVTGNEDKIFHEKVTGRNRYAVYSDPYAILDNALIWLIIVLKVILSNRQIDAKRITIYKDKAIPDIFKI